MRLAKIIKGLVSQIVEFQSDLRFMNHLLNKQKEQRHHLTVNGNSLPCRLAFPKSNSLKINGGNCRSTDVMVVSLAIFHWLIGNFVMVAAARLVRFARSH
jgi:hypothetical protein